jgi:hypothetical protein
MSIPKLGRTDFDSHQSKSMLVNSFTVLSQSSEEEEEGGMELKTRKLMDVQPIALMNLVDRRKSIQVVQHIGAQGAEWGTTSNGVLSRSFNPPTSAPSKQKLDSTSIPAFFMSPFAEGESVLQVPPRSTTPTKPYRKAVSDGDSDRSADRSGGTGGGSLSLLSLTIPPLGTGEEVPISSFGTIVFVNKFEFLHGPFHGVAHLDLSSLNNFPKTMQHISSAANRPDLTQIWKVVELMSGEERGCRDWISRVLDDLLVYLSGLNDFQTISLLFLSISQLKTLSEVEALNPKKVVVMGFFTSSPALSSFNDRVEVSWKKEMKSKSKLASLRNPSFSCVPRSKNQLPRGKYICTLDDSNLQDQKKEWEGLVQSRIGMYSGMIQNYCQYLYSLGLFNHRARFLKLLGNHHDHESVLEVGLNSASTKCSYCRLTCRGRFPGCNRNHRISCLLSGLWTWWSPFMHD